MCGCGVWGQGEEVGVRTGRVCVVGRGLGGCGGQGSRSYACGERMWVVSRGWMAGPVYMWRRDGGVGRGGGGSCVVGGGEGLCVGGGGLCVWREGGFVCKYEYV